MREPSSYAAGLMALPLGERIAAIGPIQEGCVSWSKVYFIRAGEVEPGHAHKASHDTWLIHGVAVIRRWRGEAFEEAEHVGPCVIPMPAGERHEIEAASDIAWACLWPADVNVDEM